MSQNCEIQHTGAGATGPPRPEIGGQDTFRAGETSESMMGNAMSEWVERMRAVKKGEMTTSSGPRMKAAIGLAVAADVLQMLVFPLFVEGAASPADDFLDLAVAGVLSFLLGWNWEFLPSFAGKLVPGVDMVPLWTLAVANVYRRTKKAEDAQPVTAGPTIEGQR